MEDKRNQNGTKLLSVVDRLSCHSHIESSKTDIPQTASTLYCSSRNGQNVMVQNDATFYKSINFHKYSNSANNPYANLQMTLKPSAPNGLARPSVCFCKNNVKSKPEEVGKTLIKCKGNVSSVHATNLSEDNEILKKSYVKPGYHESNFQLYENVLLKDGFKLSTIAKIGEKIKENHIVVGESGDVQQVGQILSKEKSSKVDTTKPLGIDWRTQNTLKTKILSCGVCLEQFPYVLSLERHRKGKGHYLCSNCGEVLPTEEAFKSHRDKSLCKLIQCPFCSMKFVSRDELEDHKAVVHFKCLECNKIYENADKLAAHNERNHSPPYTCLQCGVEFPTFSQCRKHATRAHKKKFFCPDCGLGFTRMSVLKRHSQYTHSKQRNFKCEICSKTFKRPDALKIHMITHADVKPFRCDECGKQFNQKVCYTKHLPCKKGKVKKVASESKCDESGNESTEAKKVQEKEAKCGRISCKGDNVFGESRHKIFDDSLVEADGNKKEKQHDALTSAALLKSSIDESYDKTVEVEDVSCRCPPTCKCKRFSLSLEVQTNETIGSLFKSSEEISCISCCCDTDTLFNQSQCGHS